MRAETIHTCEHQDDHQSVDQTLPQSHRRSVQRVGRLVINFVDREGSNMGNEQKQGGKRGEKKSSIFLQSDDAGRLFIQLILLAFFFYIVFKTYINREYGFSVVLQGIRVPVGVIVHQASNGDPGAPWPLIGDEEGCTVR